MCGLLQPRSFSFSQNVGCSFFCEEMIEGLNALIVWKLFWAVGLVSLTTLSRGGKGEGFHVWAATALFIFIQPNVGRSFFCGEMV